RRAAVPDALRAAGADCCAAGQAAGGDDFPAAAADRRAAGHTGGTDDFTTPGADRCGDRHAAVADDLTGGPRERRAHGLAESYEVDRAGDGLRSADHAAIDLHEAPIIKRADRDGT